MKSTLRRIMAVCLTALCLLGLSASFDSLLAPPAYAATQRAKAGQVYVVRVNKLNLRSGPSVKAKVITRLKKGTEVTYRKSEKGWWFVDYPKGSGYVDGKFLKGKDAESGKTTPIEAKATHVTTCRLRMRSKPSAKGKIIGTLKKGDGVSVLSQKGKWSEITFKNKQVWVFTKYLRKK